MADNPKPKRLKKDEEGEEEFKHTVFNVRISSFYLTDLIVMIDFGVLKQNAFLKA